MEFAGVDNNSLLAIAATALAPFMLVGAARGSGLRRGASALALAGCAAWLAAVARPPVAKVATPSESCVLVTGAGSGLGFQVAHAYAQLGFTVYAGVRKEADGAAVAAGFEGRILPLILDAEKEDDVRRARDTIAANPRPLAGVLANHGVCPHERPFEFVEMATFEKAMSVNFFSVVRLAQYFAPLLRKDGGRFMATSSLVGGISLANYSPYSPTKFALEAFASSMRRDSIMMGAPIPVCVAQPSFFRTLQLCCMYSTGPVLPVLYLYLRDVCYMEANRLVDENELENELETDLERT